MLKKLKNKEYNLNKKGKALVLLMIFVISGIFGYIYEVLFYKIDLGYFVNRGITYGPWIPIYGIGGLLITILTHKYQKNNILVFLSSTIITGLLELLTGYILLHVFNTRLWDYNTEILNFGNIEGFVCLRSVLFFGISALFLTNIIIPIVKYLSQKKYFSIITIILSSLFIIDIIISTLEFIIK